MPEVLKSDSLGAPLADFQRRLQILETTARVGLNRIRYAFMTNAAPAVPAAFDVWETGPTGSTYADDRGNTGNGYPRVTLEFGKRAIFLMTFQPYGLVNDAGYKTHTMAAGLNLDAGTGAGGWNAPKPPMQRFIYNGPANSMQQPFSFLGTRVDMVPGEHTVTMTANWGSVPGGATAPWLIDALLLVIPID